MPQGFKKLSQVAQQAKQQASQTDATYTQEVGQVGEHQDTHRPRTNDEATQQSKANQRQR